MHENIGVNQGVNCNPTLLQKYLYDLKYYEFTGICISSEILLHMLWADDLYMVSCNQANAQLQLDGLAMFCSPNQMIANENKNFIFGIWENGWFFFGHEREANRQGNIL